MMKKWEQAQLQKAHEARIQKAKSSVSISTNQVQILSSTRATGMIKTPSAQGSLSGTMILKKQSTQIDGYLETEKNNPKSIPLYQVLKVNQLQQYARLLISRGYGYDFSKFQQTSLKLENLLDDIKCLPGHRTRLSELLSRLSIQQHVGQVWNSPKTSSSSSSTSEHTGSTTNDTLATPVLDTLGYPSPSSQQQATFADRLKSKQLDTHALMLKQSKSIPLSSAGFLPDIHITRNSSQSCIRSNTSGEARIASQLSSKGLGKRHAEGHSNEQEKSQEYFTNDSHQQVTKKKAKEEEERGIERKTSEYDDTSDNEVGLTIAGLVNYYAEEEPTQVPPPKSHQSKLRRREESLTDLQTLPVNHQGKKDIRSTNHGSMQQTAQRTSNHVTRLSEGFLEKQTRLIGLASSPTTSTVQTTNIKTQRTVSMSRGQTKTPVTSLTGQQSRVLLPSLPEQLKNVKLQLQQSQELKQKKLHRPSIDKPLQSNKPQQLVGMKAAATRQPRKGKITVQDDIYLIPKFDETAGKIVTSYKENKLIKNLNFKLTNKAQSDELNPQLEFETVKLMYMSFDNGRLTSTLINLDIEELCFCLACAVVKLIECYNPQEEIFKSPIKARKPQLNEQPGFSIISFKKCQANDSKQEKELTLRGVASAVVDVPHSRINEDQNEFLQNAEQDESQEQFREQECQNVIGASGDYLNPEQDSQIEESGSLMQNFSQISQHSVIENDEFARSRTFNNTFGMRCDEDPVMYAMPSVESVKDFCKNVCVSCQLEKQIPIIALVYIKRLLERSRQKLTQINWRKITMTAMILASKIWDDESFENHNFAQAFSQFSVTQINAMERVFLEFIDYNLHINGQDYAKHYFILREFAQKNKRSFPLRPLDLKTILTLQNNANKALTNLREMHSNPLNKSY